MYFIALCAEKMIKVFDARITADRECMDVCRISSVRQLYRLTTGKFSANASNGPLQYLQWNEGATYEIRPSALTLD
jgi:hypothetical protein